jgi:hypothetical protein
VDIERKSKSRVILMSKVSKKAGSQRKSTRRRVDAKRNVLMRLLEAIVPTDKFPKDGKLLFALSDEHVAFVFQFLRPIELVTPLRHINRSFAYIPASWFTEAKLSIPAPPPKNVGAKLIADATDAQVQRMLAKRKLTMGPFLGKGLGGTVMKLMDTVTDKESPTYIVKIASFEDDIEGLNDFRVHKHLASVVPDCVPIVYDTALTGRAIAILMERMGDTWGKLYWSRMAAVQLEEIRQAGGVVEFNRQHKDREAQAAAEGKALPPPRDRMVASEYLTVEEQKAIIALVTRICFDGGVYHRDLHVNNITKRLDGSGGFKVIDFGRAIIWDWDVKSVEKMLAVVFPRNEWRMADLSDKDQKAAETLYALRHWFGVLELFEHRGGAILYGIKPDTVIPAAFLTAYVTFMPLGRGRFRRTNSSDTPEEADSSTDE